MARLRIAVCALSLAVVLTACGEKTARDIIGWQGYNFGMTQEQAKGVKRIPWFSTSGRDWVSAQPVAVGSFVYMAQLRFSSSGKLRDIGLLSQAGAASAEECEQRFRRVLVELGRGYGPFRAVTAEGTETTRGTTERNVETTWRKKDMWVGETEASIYDVQLIRERSSPSTPWSEKTRFESKYRTWVRSVEISGAFQDDGPFKVCLDMVHFHADD